MRRCALCGDPAQVTVIGRPCRHYCIHHAALQTEFRAAEAPPQEPLFVMPRLLPRVPGRQLRGRR